MTKVAWGAPRTVLKDRAGSIASCWRLTLGERLRLLVTGRLYLLSQSQFVLPLTKEPNAVEPRLIQSPMLNEWDKMQAANEARQARQGVALVLLIVTTFFVSVAIVGFVWRLFND